MEFDTRARVLSWKIKDWWEPKVKELWHKNKTQIKESLLAQFGPIGGYEKIHNFIDLGAEPFSIVAFHNKFFRQVRRAFVIGAYYPALTATCALGERVLNHLVLSLRDSYRATPEYKHIHNKKSFDKWDLAIDTLESWGVLLPDTASKYRQLKDIRNNSLHFRPDVDRNDRTLALESIRTFSEIVSNQFACIGPLPWFIPEIRGASFIKKSWESNPFIEKVYLPNCHLVGPLHTVEIKNGKPIVRDEYDYGDKEVTDEQFADLFNNRKI